ncbi:hypothetical protein V1477_011299, partial [Vespula maculifrons]
MRKKRRRMAPREKVPTSGETICPEPRTMNTPLPGGTPRFGIPETTAETRIEVRATRCRMQTELESELESGRLERTAGVPFYKRETITIPK